MDNTQKIETAQTNPLAGLTPEQLAAAMALVQAQQPAAQQGFNWFSPEGANEAGKMAGGVVSTVAASAWAAGTGFMAGLFGGK